MKSLILTTCLAIISFGCKKEPVITAVPFTENLHGWMTERVNGAERNLHLDFGTIKKFGCSGYEIINTFSVAGNNINFNFIKITNPAICLDVISGATAEIDLGPVANNNYNLSFNFGDTVVNGSLTVSDNSYVISTPPQNKINFPRPDIKKIPPHTIFGEMEIASGMEAAAQQYIDSLQIIGAVPVNYIPGDYLRFQIDNNGQVTQEGVNWARNFVFRFDGDTAQLRSFRGRFGTAYPNGLPINLYTNYY